MSYNPRDHYFKKAKEQNFVARSVFKLEEIDKKYRILKKGDWVLDLGASPGSWAQYTSKVVGPEGRILALDLKPLEVRAPNLVSLVADLRDQNLSQILAEHGFDRPFNVVLSDMAPNTTGIRMTDQARSMELCEIALSCADKFLAPGGHFVCKLFHSDDFKLLKEQILKSFSKFEAMKPDSTRKISKEIFLIGIRKK